MVQKEDTVVVGTVVAGTVVVGMAAVVGEAMGAEAAVAEVALAAALGEAGEALPAEAAELLTIILMYLLSRPAAFADFCEHSQDVHAHSRI